jgi:hypothetical protein
MWKHEEHGENMFDIILQAFYTHCPTVLLTKQASCSLLSPTSTIQMCTDNSSLVVVALKHMHKLFDISLTGGGVKLTSSSTWVGIV